MKESTMYNKMINPFKNAGISLTRIENKWGRVPDVYFTSKYGNGWIELKNIQQQHITKNGIIKIPWRPGQLAWITRHYRYNNNVFLIFTIKESPVFFYNKIYPPSKTYTIESLKEIRLGFLINDFVIDFNSVLKHNLNKLFNRVMTN